ncbi:MAG TPA: hypothetical protein VHA12_02690 [Candidatus Nanoarchaeia archaeon]|nr:hypothetical protein [Candidatus Nanoarchaeia archaeon]
MIKGINRLLEKNRDLICFGAGLVALEIAVAVPINAALYTGFFTQECIESRFADSKEQSLTGRLKEKSNKEYLMPGIHGTIRHATFSLEDGREIEVIDAPVVTAGKFLPNMGGLKEGSEYNFKVYGSELTGYKLISATEAK